ncbi:protein Fe65 homolog isoform X2 [Folsomia candida]|uniref:protein Fe65 homolog isoform X2 n=1 Tax=Folsomia candida TaxID=158441 RepID=UPI001604E65A|nr:protein Fe65 homolog isoform X2 [Folsomia candida]
MQDKDQEADDITTGNNVNISPSSSIDPSTPPPSSGFNNPNYDNSLQNNQNSSETRNSRRFFYAALSPTDMGVNEPVLFLSPDDQVNNNSTIPPEAVGVGVGLSANNVISSSAAANNSTASTTSKITTVALPAGWEKHDDANGPYYWHIKSGTIQRDPPTQQSISNSNPALLIPGSLQQSSVTPFRRSQTISSQLSTSSSVAPHNNSNNSGNSTNVAEKRKSWSQYLENSEHSHSFSSHSSHVPLSQQDQNDKDDKPLRFVAVSLGCLSISEEDLTPERSSRAVSKVIAELTNPNSKIGSAGLEVAGKIWGGGNELFLKTYVLELDDSHLRVKVKERILTVLEQPIHSIRVWGVGREDPRDFAFVAREKQTRQFLCHVFRLEMYARPLANSLRDACKKIMIERQAKQKRPTTLPTSLRSCKTSSSSGPTFFPTPMDEPRKVIKAYYMGSKVVMKPTGMETLNAAIDALGGKEPIPVQVSVAPSVIKITSEESDTPNIDLEVRVRFLSFLGIGADVKTCGIIVHTAKDDFEAHCFYSNPSTGALCKAVEAACVLRYQKCLDAHHAPAGAGQSGHSSGGSTASITSPKTTAANLASALKTVFASFGKAKSEEK